MKAVIKFEDLEDVMSAFLRLEKKYGKDWTEWKDVREALDKVWESAEITRSSL